jgi:hypothetical protein
MTGKPAEPEDPMALVGVAMDRGPDEESLTEMAWCFAEEYVRMGWSGERILRLFKNPFYRGPYQALQAKGEASVLQIIEAVEQVRHEARAALEGRR